MLCVRGLPVHLATESSSLLSRTTPVGDHWNVDVFFSYIDASFWNQAAVGWPMGIIHTHQYIHCRRVLKRYQLDIFEVGCPLIF